MNRTSYQFLERYMEECMQDGAHDREHVYRVLSVALEIAQTEKEVDYDILICACLLHDIGRQEQLQDSRLDHAQVGADKAYKFLLEHGYEESFAARVRDCIRSHRYRSDCLPETIEAKILFDADKIDVSGAIGIARTLLYQGETSQPLYSMLPDGTVSSGESDQSPSFFREYHFKLKHLYSHFYTRKGSEIAGQRQKAAMDFYENLAAEVNAVYQTGEKQLKLHLQ